MIYDTVIIGAGPAGAHLSYLLAKARMNVALVDQMRFPREKLCGGLLTCKTIELLSSSYPDNYFSWFDIKTVHTFYKYEFVASFQLLSPICTVSRQIFDSALVNASKEQGAHTYLGTPVQSIDFQNREVYLQDGRILRYVYLVGADGAKSKVRRLASLPCNQTGFCLEAYVPWRKIKSPERLHEGGIEIYYGNHAMGYSWVFPRSDSVVIGVGNITDSTTKKEVIASFHPFLNRIALAEGIRFRGAYLPSGTSIVLGNTNYENLCLIGDAAGLIDPFTGEGIYYAFQSAKIAANAIVSGMPVYSKYKQQMVQTVNTIQDAVQVRNAIYTPIILRDAIASMQSVPQYSEKLIDEVIVRNVKTYRTAYEEYKCYIR